MVAVGMGGVFISYRRDDTAPYAGRLRDRLTAVFGNDQIFRDVDRVAPGERFPVVIERAVSSCDAFIALIGTRWLMADDDHGRRIDDPRDYVRQEVAAALRREDVLVIPVLVEGAAMPEPDDLPEELTPLAERNALVMSDIRWNDDMNHLVEALQRVVRPPGRKRAAVKPRERGRGRPAPDPRPAPAPLPPTPPPVDDRRARPVRSRFPVVTAVVAGVACLALVAVIALVAGGGGGDGEEAVGAGGTTVATTVPGPVTLAVPGNQAWTDTRVDVKVNQTVFISATGRIRHHDDPPLMAGPEGNPDPGLRQFNLPDLGGYNHAALIAKIGEGGKPFYVGPQLTLTAPTAGRLFLGINDPGVHNNGEAFTATVRAA